jgi:hypothetical protein
MSKIVLRSALQTVLALFGGLLVGLVLGDIVFKLLPGHSLDNPAPMHVTIAAIPALAGFLAGGAAWGAAMGRIAGTPDRRRMAWAGLLGFGPITLTLAVGLSVVEPPLVAEFGASTGIHRIFTLLFVPAASLIAGVSAWAIGRGLQDKELARALFWRVGLTAGATFLVINLGMETAGWVVGAPGAAQRATMVTVLAVGNIGAALAGGGMIGWLLSARSLPPKALREQEAEHLECDDANRVVEIT